MSSPPQPPQGFQKNPQEPERRALGRIPGWVNVAGGAVLVLLVLWALNASTQQRNQQQSTTGLIEAAPTGSPINVAPTVPAPPPTTAAPVPDSVKAEAVDLLGAAGSQRQAGQLGLALELARQALGKWPDYTEARRFITEVSPQATVAAAQAASQATVQAQAQATAVAGQPIVVSGRGPKATDVITPRTARSVVSFTHDGRSNFVVNLFRGDSKQLLVNRIGRYEGQRPILGTQAFALSIDADGAWSVRLEPIKEGGAAPFGGGGDKVSGLFLPPSTGPWEFSHTGKSNFVVHLYCGNDRSLIQNRIGEFNGSDIIRFGSAPCFWEVEADGAWSLLPRQ